MPASEVETLARQASIGPRVAVLDLCCGVAGPGRFITREFGCGYLGVDADPSALEIARACAAGLPCRFEVARVPPIPAGPFDVILVLETMLAFADKEALVAEISSALTPGGRFAFTLEAGPPLSAAERASMPHADTVWLIPWDEMATCLARAGLVVRWQDDLSGSHRAVVDALVNAFAADAAHIAAQIGRGTLDELLLSHRLWSAWLREGRVRKIAVVAERT